MNIESDDEISWLKSIFIVHTNNGIQTNNNAYKYHVKREHHGGAQVDNEI